MSDPKTKKITREATITSSLATCGVQGFFDLQAAAKTNRRAKRMLDDVLASANALLSIAPGVVTFADWTGMSDVDRGAIIAVASQIRATKAQPKPRPQLPPGATLIPRGGRP